MGYPYGETVVLHQYSSQGIDAQGNDIPGYTDITYERCPVYPVDANGYAANEVTGGRDTVTIGLAALLPRGTPVSALDRATTRGGLYEVDGKPNDLASFFTGWHPGVLVTLRRVEG